MAGNSIGISHHSAWLTVLEGIYSFSCPFPPSFPRVVCIAVRGRALPWWVGEGTRSPPLPGDAYPPAFNPGWTRGQASIPGTRRQRGAGGGAGGAARLRVRGAGLAPRCGSAPGLCRFAVSGRIDAAPGHRCCPAPRLITAARESFWGAACSSLSSQKLSPLSAAAWPAGRARRWWLQGQEVSTLPPLSEALFSGGQVGGAVRGATAAPPLPIRGLWLPWPAASCAAGATEAALGPLPSSPGAQQAAAAGGASGCSA